MLATDNRATDEQRPRVAASRVARGLVVGLVERFYRAVDARDYAGVRACLADRIGFDYSRLGFAPVADPDAFVAFVRERHAPYAWVEHRLSGLAVRVGGDRARGHAAFVARHGNPDAPVRSVAGRYDYGFERSAGGWRIAGCVVTPNAG